MNTNQNNTEKHDGILGLVKNTAASVFNAISVVASIAVVILGVVLWVFCQHIWEKYIDWVNERFGLWEILAEPVGFLLLVLGVLIIVSFIAILIVFPLRAICWLLGVKLDDPEAANRVPDHTDATKS